MKRSFLIALIGIASFALIRAQAPQGFKYQAVIRDASGALIQGKPVSIKISLIEGSPDGTIIYEEKHKEATNNYGLVSLTVGRGLVLQGDFSQIDWSTGSKWIGIAVDPTGGNNYTIAGTAELLSVPYAIYAGTAGNSNPPVINYPDSSDQNEVISTFDFDPVNGKLTIVEAGVVRYVNLDIKQDDLSDNSLNDLADVNATPKNGDILRWDGSQWVGSDGSDFYQQLAIISNMLTLTNGNNVNLSPYLDNTDEQQLNYDPATHILTLSNGGQVDLTTLYNPNSPTYNTGLYFDSLTNELTVTDNGTFFTVDLTKLATDLDSDPTNEFNQSLSYDPGTAQLTLTDGGSSLTADISSLLGQGVNTGAAIDHATNVLTITDDASSQNVDLSYLLDNTDEQQLSFDAATNTLTLSNGGQVDLASLYNPSTPAYNSGLAYDSVSHILSITDGGNTLSVDLGSLTNIDVNDADADPTNEYNLSLNFDPATMKLSLVDGGSTLTADVSALADQGKNTGFNYNDNTGQLTITDDNSSMSVDLSTLMNTPDGDSDDANELQTLSLSGDTLYLSNGGGAVVIPNNTAVTSANLNGTNNYLVKFTPNGTTGGNSQIFDNGTSVCIGTYIPTSKLHVNATGQSPFAVDLANQTKFIVAANGNIGLVDANTPAYKIDAVGSDNGVLMRVYNASNSGTGLTAVGNGVAGYLPTNGSGISGTGFSIGVAGFATNSANSAFGGYFFNDNVYAYVGGWNLSNGAFTPYKIIGNGTVSTIVPGVNGDKVTMFSPEAPEVLFQDYGTAELVNGKAYIKLDPNYANNINVDADHPMKVFIQLEGDCKGVYVTNKTVNGFEVVELDNGTSNTSFSWMIVATRKNEMIKLPNGEYKKASYDVRFPQAPDMLPTNFLDKKKGE